MKDILFSVTAKDCRFDYFRGSGKGGQKRNKTSSGVRCTHVESGAVGQSDDTRSQHKNKVIAFGRMAETKEFKAWHKIEVAKKTGQLLEVEKRVNAEMKKILVEENSTGVWKEYD